MSRTRVLIGAILLTALLAPPVVLGAGDNVFGAPQVYAVNIEFTQTAWWDSLVYYYDEGLEHMMPATVTIDGVVMDSVGVRLKGNASYSHPNDKKPFRLKFDEFLDDQRWDGLKSVHLNNCWEDPTFLREKLHLDVLHDAGVAAPRGNFVELSLNGELWGFYSLVEHVDKTFLGAHYPDNDGNLYKAVDGFLYPYYSDFKWYGSDPGPYYNRYELKTDEPIDPWTDLIAVIDSLNNTPDVATALPPVVNLTSIYRAIGLDLMLANLDSYTGSGRNFYVYFEPTSGRMEWAIWDVGMSLGSYWSLAQNYETLSLTYVSNPSNRPLTAKIFANPTLLEAYLHEVCLLNRDYFSTERFFPQIESLAELVRPYVYADPRKMYTNEQFETNLYTDITVGGHRKPGLESFLTQRTANVASQLEALGVTCPVVVEPGDVVINEFEADNTLILDPAGDAEDWIEFYNNTTDAIDLGGMYLSDDPTVPTKWQFPDSARIEPDGYLIVWADNELTEAGLHASFKLSAGGETILFSDPGVARLDSVAFGQQTTDLSMARIPNGTGEFVQGEPTFNANNGNGMYVQPGDLTLNEFAASNSIILDPAGEAEDWIELHNNTGAAITLDGMFLTDNALNPAQWRFPAGTMIGAEGYVIVWADEDLTQEGLHANFKLSAGGEYLGLADSTGAPLDEITFGQQTQNLTLARIPNGTGAWVQGPPTFNLHNGFGNWLTPGEVVINEFMADNDSIPDPSGDTDDWLELYNLTDHELALGGLYLSDNLDSPGKWRIPEGTTIAADGYLVVWADEDLTQPGLHANFKLSAGGEALVFSNPDLAVLDSTTFGPQTTNQSMARVPNGTGPFVPTRFPTPGSENGDPSDAPEGGRPREAGLGRIAHDRVQRALTIEYRIAQAGAAILQVHDLAGRLVTTLVEQEVSPGVYRAVLPTRSLSSGVYLCRLRSGPTLAVQKFVVVN